MNPGWHGEFNPQKFLGRINIDSFIEKNEAYNESVIQTLSSPCILCRSLEGPGLILNDKSYLCKNCFQEASQITYPEKYEKLKREYIREREARKKARQSFIENCHYLKNAKFISTCVWVSLVGLFLHIGLVVIPIVLFFISTNLNEKHAKKMAAWERSFPLPVEPELLHFHDPRAILSSRDRLILKIFNHWPGYPPFWNYLREVVIGRDGGKCQVTGCPSRVTLHVHHKKPVSNGGPHSPENLITLCDFHHALEPDQGHERVWGNVKTSYFTLVRGHERQNRATGGTHNVKAHVRRLELIKENDLKDLKELYGFACTSCDSSSLQFTSRTNSKNVSVVCLSCNTQWEGPRQLAEETGPRLAENLKVTKNEGHWKARWEMLASRTNSITGNWRSKKVVAKRQKIKEEKRISNEKPHCPKCGSPMRLIKPRQGQNWSSFWGCTKYRTKGCKGSINP